MSKLVYGSVQALTLNANSLASSTALAAESAPIDNTVNGSFDYLVTVTVKLAAAGTPGSDQGVYVYAAGSVDGTTWPDTTTGAASAAGAPITLNSPTQLREIGFIPAVALGATYRSEPLSLLQAFGAELPPYMTVVLRNFTGVAFDATAGASLVSRGVSVQ